VIIAVTGATGFIGRHVRDFLAASDHNVRLLARDPKKVGKLARNESIVEGDIGEAKSNWFELLGFPDTVIHLAWGGLPNHLDSWHVDTELPRQLQFLISLLNGGLKKLLIAGTCYEYGLVHGAISETDETKPNTSYGLAKDALRREIFRLKSQLPFELVWARIFYPFGEGQFKDSLYSELQRCIESGRNDFCIGSGDLVLDFVDIREVARVLVELSISAPNIGIINIGSGKPRSVYEFVESLISLRNSNIQIVVGGRTDRPHESPSFWADIRKLDAQRMTRTGINIELKC